MIFIGHIFHDPQLCRDILIHDAVAVQVVGGEVQKYGYIRLEMVDLFHLERTHLQNVHGIFRLTTQVFQHHLGKRGPYVATFISCETRLAAHLCQDGCGGCFPI